MISRSSNFNSGIEFLFLLSVILFSLGSCKDENLDENKSDNDIVTVNLDKINEVLSLDDAIDSVATIRINSKNILTFHTIMFSIIRKSGDLYFGVNHDLNTIVVFDKNGIIKTTILARQEDKVSPHRIDFFDIHPTDPYVYVLDGAKMKVYVYTFEGALEKVFDIPNDKNTYYKLFYFDENKFIFQRKPTSFDTQGLRENGVIGAVFNHYQKSLKPILMEGGSSSRDLNLSYGFEKYRGGVLFHYNQSPLIHTVYDDELKVSVKFDGKGVSPKDLIEAIDKSPFASSNNKFNALYEVPNIIEIRFVYEVDDILFITYFEGNTFKWLFYNKRLRKSKVTKVDTYNIGSAKGGPIKHIIKNGNGNMLMIFEDGEALQNNKEFKEKYDPNSTYLLKIYPKYLNQSAWEE